MAIRIPWDKYEAALLLDYCIKVESKEISRREAVSTVSQILRYRAVCNGYEIDDVFRNENGIGMQLSSMRNCYLGKKQGLTISKLFYEIVKLQKDNPEDFAKILQEESEKMDISTWQEFLRWLKENHTEREKEILSSLMMVNAFGRKSRALNKPLGDMNDPKEIEKLMELVMTSSSFGLQTKKNINAAVRALQIYAEFLRKKIETTRIEEKPVETLEIGNDAEYIVDFHISKSYAHTKPSSCTYKGEVIEKSGWNALFLALVQKIYKDYKEIFPAGKSLSSSTRIDTGAADNMIYPKEIADGIYLECNVSATVIISKLRALMDICAIDYEDIKITYRPTGISPENNTVETVLPKWQPQYTDGISQLLIDKYKYGFRLGSPIELMKIRNYAESAEIELPDADEELKKEICAAGVTIDGKVYVFSKDLLDGLGRILDGIFQEGNKAIFLTSFISKQETWLEENHIIGEVVLKAVLKRCRPHLYFGQNIIISGSRMTEHEAVVSEIHRVAGQEPMVLLSDLTNRLPYIPTDKIAWSLSASDEFVWVSEGKYFRIRYFVCGKDDADRIIEFVSDECNTKGYASITDVPMGEVEEENYELSTTALYSAVYNYVLKGHFYLNGKILTIDQNGVDITDLLKAYCRDRDECTASELMNRAEELTGNSNKQYSLTALYDTLVRADSNLFVSEGQVSFDVDVIDDLLKKIIGARFAPIRKVSTFVLFPTCGINWNHYVLESYCYRFSKKYRLSVLNYNDKNVGVIVAANLPLTYNEIICEAVANADIELTQEEVGEYLFSNGFSARRKYSNMPEIIEKAKSIREEG